MPILAPRKPRLWIWFMWIAAFYSVWSWLVFGLDRRADVTANRPIALAMSVGSYVAGATPMGRGLGWRSLGANELTLYRARKGGPIAKNSGVGRLD